MPFLGQIGGEIAGIRGRIKDFVILKSQNGNVPDDLIIVAASSDGTVRIWNMRTTDLLDRSKSNSNRPASPHNGKKTENGAALVESPNSRPDLNSHQIGSLLGEYQTTNRITCLTAFTMMVHSHPTKNQDSEAIAAREEEFEGFD